MLINIIEAINQALEYALINDAKVLLLGEDIGKNGGVFRATVGLQEKFPQRVLDTPLAENMLAGIAVGMAACGLKPVVEIQFMGFLYAALDQVINHASRMRNRTTGRLTCPLVIRIPYGAGIHAPEHHSESTEALLAHIPGLRIVVPSSPTTAYRLLLAAINDPDPVIFLEPIRLYRSFAEDVNLDGAYLPLDKALILKAGKDITLISWGAMMQETLAAANILLEHNVAAEVIDLLTIKPIDIEVILQSIQKTGKVIIIHEAARNGGVGAEIAAQIAEFGLTSLLAPIKRVTGFDTIVPCYKLENLYLPTVAKILTTVEEILNYA